MSIIKIILIKHYIILKSTQLYSHLESFIAKTINRFISFNLSAMITKYTSLLTSSLLRREAGEKFCNAKYDFNINKVLSLLLCSTDEIEILINNNGK